MLFFGFFHLGADGLQHIFAFAQLHHIEKRCHRLAVAHAGAACDHQRIVFIAVFGIKRNAGKLQHGQNVGIAQLILQRKAYNIELAHRVFAFQRIQGHLQAFHLGLHIGPGHKHPLAPPVFVLIQNIIQDLFAQKRHTHFIGIRKAEGHAHIHFAFILDHTARLAAGITAGLLHMIECFFEFWCKHSRFLSIIW